MKRKKKQKSHYLSAAVANFPESFLRLTSKDIIKKIASCEKLKFHLLKKMLFLRETSPRPELFLVSGVRLIQ